MTKPNATGVVALALREVAATLVILHRLHDISAKASTHVANVMRHIAVKYTGARETLGRMNAEESLSALAKDLEMFIKRGAKNRLKTGQLDRATGSKSRRKQQISQTHRKDSRRSILGD